MPNEVKLPRLGQGMESGTIVKWLKAEGEEVEKGEPLYELDTDKVTQEVEADFSGVLLRIAVEEGEVPVGQTIAVIGQPGDSEELADSHDGRAGVDVRVEPAAEPKPPVSRRTPESRQERIKASPLARRIARERGVDLRALPGTGPEGRIVAEDVERAAAPSPARAPAARAPERRPLSSMRRAIARRLAEAWQVPVFQLLVSADMTRALPLRERLVELHPEVRPTISDLLVKVCAAALMRYPEVNASFGEEAIELYPSANVGLAVAVPDGLVVPVIAECERKSIADIAAVRADLVQRARAGKLRQQDLEGGTFTISNLGMFGVERFTAVINPPQAATLAVGAVQERPVAVEGVLAVRPQMELTLTCDHRALNGAVGAEFLGAVKSFLEEPGLAL